MDICATLLRRHTQMLLCAFACATTSCTNATAPQALVYSGPAGCDGCSEALGAVLTTAGFDVVIATVDEITADTLARTALYAQPGGGQDLLAARAAFPDDTWARLEQWVSSGGHYLGMCMGAYLAGRSLDDDGVVPGLSLFPGDTDSEFPSDAAQIATVTWRGSPRAMYAQDPPQFILDDDAAGVVVEATFASGRPAALIAEHGAGAAGLVGPHPEANDSWYDEDGLRDPDGLDADLLVGFVNRLMATTP